jgi:acid phosphatase
MPTPTPQAARVFLIVMENESYSAMVGSTDMPYLNSLIPQGGIADNFFANTHPSIGNYFMLTTGKLITSDDSGFNDVVTDNNLVRAIRKGGKDWKAYIEDLPSEM